MKLGLKKFLKAVAKFGPLILMATPLAPIAPIIVAAIQEAEQIKGASGTQKLAHVVKIAGQAADAANTIAGAEVVKKADMEATAGAVISAVVQVVNLAQKPTP